MGSFKIYFIIVGILFMFFQEIKPPAMNFSEFEPYLHKQNDTTYVINFWATWCRPCVKELPYFEQINAKYKEQKVKVILVSLDFADESETKLIPFIKRKELKSEIIILDDPDANSWINKVDEKWSGAIPATIIYKGNQRIFHEGELNFEDIEKRIVNFKNIKE